MILKAVTHLRADLDGESGVFDAIPNAEFGEDLADQGQLALSDVVTRKDFAFEDSYFEVRSVLLQKAAAGRPARAATDNGYIIFLVTQCTNLR